MSKKIGYILLITLFIILLMFIQRIGIKINNNPSGYELTTYETIQQYQNQIKIEKLIINQFGKLLAIFDLLLIFSIILWIELKSDDL